MEKLIVAKGSGLAELVEVGEMWERKKLTGKTWRGLVLLNLPKAQADKHRNDPRVLHALKWIAKLPNA